MSSLHKLSFIFVIIFAIIPTVIFANDEEAKLLELENKAKVVTEQDLK